MADSQFSMHPDSRLFRFIIMKGLPIKLVEFVQFEIYRRALADRVVSQSQVARAGWRKTVRPGADLQISQLSRKPTLPFKTWSNGKSIVWFN